MGINAIAQSNDSNNSPSIFATVRRSLLNPILRYLTPFVPVVPVAGVAVDPDVFFSAAFLQNNESRLIFRLICLIFN